VSGRMCISSGCKVQAPRDCASYISWNNGLLPVCLFLYNGIIIIEMLDVVIFECVFMRLPFRVFGNKVIFVSIGP
jgi:hypothetical protein